MMALTVQAEVRPLGHNVTQTDYLPDKTCTIGSQAVLCSNGDIGLGTAPFLWSVYNMGSVFGRIKLFEDKKQSHSLQAAYFKTIEQEPIIYEDDWGEIEWVPGYQMEAQWLTYIYSKQISPVYRFHLNISGQNYSFDRQPFSIRRPTIKRDPFQLNITTLHEAKLSEHFGIIGEFGVIHATDVYPRFHTGASLNYQYKDFYVQAGFSMTATYAALFEGRAFGRNDYQAWLQGEQLGYEGYLDPELIKYDFSIHPEFVIQYQF